MHPFNDVEGCFQSLGLFDRDDALFADLVHRLGDHVTDGRIIVGGDRAYLSNLFGILGRLGKVFELVDYGFNGLVDPAL